MYICRCRAPPRRLYTHRILAATKKAINFDSVNNNSFFFPLSTALKSMHICTIYFPPGEIIQTQFVHKIYATNKAISRSFTNCTI